MTTSAIKTQRRGLWAQALRRLAADRWAIASISILAFYALIAILAKFEWIATPWDRVVGDAYAGPSAAKIELLFGTDIFGRSVLYKVIHGARVAMSVGLVSSLISVPIGVTLGALGGYFGGKIDDAVVWLYTTLSSIPHIMLLIAVTYVMGKGLFAIYVALGITSWVGLARVMRGEFLKHRSREYVIAAGSLGVGHFGRIFRHIFPNVFHFVIINVSIGFMSAIKSEVILSFLGLGVQGQPSWGIMIDDAKMELSRWVWWQLAGSTGAMFFVVLAFNLLGDSLRDALDPKL